jgi:hypothetical protein
MNIFSELIHLIEFLVVIAVVLVILFVVLLIVVSKMPDDNPLKMVLWTLAQRMGVTAGVIGLVDPAATAFPVIGELTDIGSLIFLGYYWITGFRKMLTQWNAPPSYRGQNPSLHQQQAAPSIEHIQE